MIDSIAGSLSPFAAWILFASLKSIAVIALVLLIRRLFVRWLAPQVRYGLWFAVIACLSIPFGAQVEVQRDSPAAMPAPLPTPSPSITPFHEQPGIVIIDTPATATRGVSIASRAILVWLAGITALSIAVLHNANRYRRMKSSASDVEPATEELLDRCRQVVKIRRRVRILETSQIESPVVVGYWQPTLLVPPNLSTRISREQLRMVLLHELTHVKRHDILANWLITLVQIAHWFNPLSWYALRIMRNDMEQACDASVLQRLSITERLEYGDTLIRMADLAPPRVLLAQHASVIESRSQLKARINMITQFRSRTAGGSLLGAALIALIVCVAVTQAADAPQPAILAPPPAPVKPTLPPTTPVAIAGKTTRTAAPRKEKKAASAPRLHSELLQINHADATELVSFIRSVPGIGFLSAEGRIVADKNTNSIFVLDTSGNIFAIRQLVARLDVPVQKVLIEAVVAMVDGDLVRELTGSTVPAGGSSPVVALAQGQTLDAVLDAAQRANRAEVLSAPVMVAQNRSRASIEQSAPGVSILTLAFTPTVWPDRRMELNVEISLTSKILLPGIMTTPDTPLPPAIDLQQLKTQIVLESGATVMLRAGDGQKLRQLVVFARPRLMPNPPADSRPGTLQ